MQKRRAWISMPAQVQYQGAGMSRMIGLSGFCVLSRARESWLEDLGDEERLKLEQRSVTFAGSFLLLEQEEERNTEGLRSLMAGQRRASACLSFRFDSRLFMEGRSADKGSNVADTGRSTVLFVRLIDCNSQRHRFYHEAS
jgi:hypothetical protein